ncbi:opioid growth factor receptor-related protein [Amylibacter sp.]|nr:opioid growth factor receptor-related protein [Amylibacter sp.]
MDLIAFLKNEETDFKGRSLSDIWAYDDSQIEANHDFIQLLFPLNKASQHSFHGIYLNDDAQVAEIKNNKAIQANILTSANWFLMFLKRVDYWRVGYNHNHLRITRIIECLRLLIDDNKADKFYKDILTILGSDIKINKKTIKFWTEA